MTARKTERMARRARKSGQEKTPRGAVRMDEAALLALFKERGRPLTVKDVLSGLGAPKVQKAQAVHLLDALTQAGRIIRIQGAWGLAESMRLVTGRLQVQRSGVGYVILDDKRRKDVFVNPRDFGLAWHGDRVAVALTRHGGRNPEGRVVRVLERGMLAMPCRVERLIKPGLALCRPTDPRHLHALLLETAPGETDPAPGDVLTLEAGEMLDHQLFAARLVETLGRETDLAVQERMVKLNHQIPGPFPERCLEEAALLPAAPGEADLLGRQDLRALDFVTIDGETARDFDDAVLVEDDGKGYLLRVAIADVAHYVPPGSALDREAMERGNSCYFPLSVEPMFPEALSNGLCSLNPGVNRLAMTATIRFDASGTPGRCDFAPAVIRSAARLTYEQVHAALAEEGPVREALAPLLPMLRRAETLARALRARRDERGSLDFELPEPEIRLDPATGGVDILARQRRFSHQIIEEFMIAANEAVARHLTEHGAPLPYRVHPEPDPDKLETLFGVLSRTELGLSLPDAPTPRGLQQLVARARGTDLEFLSSRLLLRSMMQARYHTVNAGHYGLASECYCHFTSPIRRYADLCVHRALKAVLRGEAPPVTARRLQTVCDTLSLRERAAMEAEREMLKRAAVLFLRDKTGQEFEGVVSSLSDFGFWVELPEVLCEGLVRLSTLTDDYYALFPERQELLGQRTGRRFRLGQKVRVTLTDVSLARLEVNLALADGRAGLPRRQQRKLAGKAGGKKGRRAR